MAKRSLALVLAVSCVVGVVLFVTRVGDDSEVVHSSIADTSSPQRAPDPEPTDARPALRTGASSKALTRPSAPTSEFESYVPQPYTASIDTNVHIEEWLKSVEKQFLEATPEALDRKRREADAGDAEAAMWLYIVHRECLFAPGSQSEMDGRVEMFENQLEAVEGPPDYQEMLLLELEKLAHISEFCTVFAEEDSDLLEDTLVWLHRAADLGHMGAQRIYHARGRELITDLRNGLAFRNPGLINEYVARADLYVRSLLENRHPHGLSLLSRMLAVGDVYEQDYPTAYAYARAAELVADGPLREEVMQRMNLAIRFLSPEELTEAEELARAIVREWR